MHDYLNNENAYPGTQRVDIIHHTPTSSVQLSSDLKSIRAQPVDFVRNLFKL